MHNALVLKLAWYRYGLYSKINDVIIVQNSNYQLLQNFAQQSFNSFMQVI